jgi:SulP family sulfate permease
LKDEKPWQDELPFYDEYKESVNQALERTAIFWIYNVSQNQVATIDKKIKVLIIRMDHR